VNILTGTQFPIGDPDFGYHKEHKVNGSEIEVPKFTRKVFWEELLKNILLFEPFENSGVFLVYLVCGKDWQGEGDGLLYYIFDNMNVNLCRSIANLPPSRAISTWVGKNHERKK